MGEKKKQLKKTLLAERKRSWRMVYINQVALNRLLHQQEPPDEKTWDSLVRPALATLFDEINYRQITGNPLFQVETEVVDMFKKYCGEKKIMFCEGMFTNSDKDTWEDGKWVIVYDSSAVPKELELKSEGLSQLIGHMLNREVELFGEDKKTVTGIHLSKIGLIKFRTMPQKVIVKLNTDIVMPVSNQSFPIIDPLAPATVDDIIIADNPTKETLERAEKELKMIIVRVDGDTTAYMERRNQLIEELGASNRVYIHQTPGVIEDGKIRPMTDVEFTVFILHILNREGWIAPHKTKLDLSKIPCIDYDAMKEDADTKPEKNGSVTQGQSE